ncbi:MAG TPA: methyltransferase domain-containing protein [Polyangiaceae bacterium]
MNLRSSLPLLAAVLALACSRASEERDSQIGRTTYDGSEHMQPASGTAAPGVEVERTAPEPANEAPPAPEATTAPDTIGVPESAASSPPGSAETPEKRVPDVIYVPTPQPIVDKMLELARVKKDDVVYDLGCGDGRIVVTAAKRYGARAVGFDIDPERISEARLNVKKNKVEHLVSIEQKDIFTLDLTPASVVTLYLLPKLNDRLVPQLEKLAPGSRVVSHNYDFTDLVPVQALDMKPRGENEEHSVFFYTIPFKKTRGLALPPAPVPAPTVR